MRDYGPWKIIETHEVYRDPWMSVRRDEVIRPDGKAGTHSVAAIKPGVSVLAIDQNNDAYLTREFHYAVGRVTLETVSGGCEANETPLETAKRELAEEIGVTASEWVDMGTCDPFTASMLSPTGLFLARELDIGKANPEGTELIEIVKIPLAEAIQKVIASEITHAPSGLLILKAARYLGV